MGDRGSRQLPAIPDSERALGPVPALLPGTCTISWAKDLVCRTPEVVVDSGAARVVPLLKSETESGHLGSCREVDGDAGAFLCRPEPDVP